MQNTRMIGVVAAITVASVFALTGCSDGDAAPRSSSSAHRPDTTATSRADAASFFSILRKPAAAQDALPADLTTAPDDMVPNSARFAVEHDGGVCLIAWNGDPDSNENYSVSGGQDLEPASVVTSMIDERERQTLLVTDGFTSTGADPLQELAPNVWLSAPGD